MLFFFVGNREEKEIEQIFEQSIDIRISVRYNANIQNGCSQQMFGFERGDGT